MARKKKFTQKPALRGFMITGEPMMEPGESAEEDALSKRLHRLAVEHPAEAIDELKAAIKRYPHKENFYNYLACAYESSGKKTEAYKLVRETYKQFPEYLFAKCAYANIQLLADIIDDIPAIFNNTFDLGELYPDRSIFHVTEVAAVSITWCNYFCRKGDPETASIHLALLKHVVPDDPRIEKLAWTISMLKTVRKLCKSARKNG